MLKVLQYFRGLAFDLFWVAMAITICNITICWNCFNCAKVPKAEIEHQTQAYTCGWTHKYLCTP
jgi:hypothetical protein